MGTKPMVDIIDVSKLRTVRIKIDGSCMYNGHGGWGVVVYDQRITNHAGHILTNHSVTAEKMALAMALILSPNDRMVMIYTDCMANMKAFNLPNMSDEIDAEIAILKAGKPLTTITLTARNNVKEAHILARREAKRGGR